MAVILSQTPDYVHLLSEPFFLKDEDPARFKQLVSILNKEIKPETFLLRFQVQELAVKIWTIQRTQRLGSVLMKDARRIALASLSGAITDNPQLANILANKYVSDNPQKKKEAKQLLLGNGITDEIIDNKAAALYLSGLSSYDKLAANQQISLVQLLKYIARQQKNTIKKMKKPSKAFSEPNGPSNSSGKISN